MQIMIAKDELLDTLTRNLNVLMERNGLGVRELARNCDLSAMTISKLSRGQAKMPTLDVVLKIADYFGLSVEELAEKKIR